MFKKLFLIIFLSVFIMSCNDQNVINDPAQEQIKDYTKKLADCHDDDDKSEENGKDHNELEKNDKIDKKEKSVVNKDKNKKIFFVKSKEFIKSDDIVLGNKDSEAVLIEYFSPTCPGCAMFHKTVFPKVKEKFIDTGKVKYVMREILGNKQDMHAAMLARCAKTQDRYLKFIDVLLDQQKNWAFSKNYHEIITNIGILGGISPEQYAKCLVDSAKLESLIENGRIISKDSSFQATPSFYLNGKFISPSIDVNEFLKKIEDKIEEFNNAQKDKGDRTEDKKS